MFLQVYDLCMILLEPAITQLTFHVVTYNLPLHNSDMVYVFQDNSTVSVVAQLSRRWSGADAGTHSLCLQGNKCCGCYLNSCYKWIVTAAVTVLIEVHAYYSTMTFSLRAQA